MDTNMLNPMQVASPLPAERSIGAILIDAGRLTPEDADRILRLQDEEGMRFGDAALQLGVLTDEDIQYALARQYGYPYLMRGDAKVVSDELVAAYQPFSPQSEAFRALRSQLKMRWFTGEPDQRTLAIVSTERGVGRSYLAANMAVVFAQLGERTLLVDADMRNPRQHTLFNLDNRSGLSSLLANRGKPGDVRRMSTFLDLNLLVAGPTPPNPQELLGRAAFDKFLSQASQEYDVILIDTPAGSVYADAQIIAAKARGALLATQKDKTPLHLTRRLCHGFSNLGVSIVGTVLSDF